MSGFNQLPRDGNVVSFFSHGRFIGKTNHVGKDLETSHKLGELEGFAIEHDGNKFAFRQVTSGLYLGGQIHNNRTPLLVQKRDDWELFTLENRGNNTYAIKSHDNTYLTIDGERLVWKSQPANGNELWTVQTLFNAPHGFNQGFSKQGAQGVGYVDGKLHGHLANWLSSLTQKPLGPFPNNGEEFSIKKDGRYVGGTRNTNENVVLVNANKSCEKYLIETLPDGKYAIKQTVSGHYLGGEINKNRTPGWAQVLNDWEKFTLEDRGNGNVAFRSHFNTYLTVDGDNLVWREKGENGNELFQFERPNAVQIGQGFNAGGFNAQQAGNYGVPSVGNIFSFGQGNHFVGGVRNQNEAVQTVGKAGDWERFIAVEAPNGKVSFKQQTSGLFLGGAIQNERTPLLVPAAQDWQFFTLENRGNETFAIKSHVNTYLTEENGKLVWKQNPGHGRQVWSFTVHNHHNHHNQGFNQTHEPQSQFPTFQGGFQSK